MTTSYLRSSPKQSGLASCRNPEPTQLVGQDVAPERLATLLAEQGESLTLLSAEGGIIGTLAGKYSDGRANLDLANAAYSAEPVTVDRQGRPSIRLTHPHLAIGLAVQPDVLREMRDTGQMLTRGFLDRFLLAVPQSRVGTRRLRIAKLSERVRSEWSNLVVELARTATDLLSKGERVTLTLSPEADRRYEPWWEHTERRMRDGGDLAELSRWVQKCRGTVLRISALLALLQNPHTLTVEAAQMRSALALSEYLVSHAGYVHSDPVSGPTARVLTAVVKMPEGRFSSRELHRKVQNQKWCRGVEDVERELLQLHRLGYLRQLAPEYGSNTRKWERHPALVRQ